MKIGRYPLRELVQLGRHQNLPKLRLTDQDQLQNLKLIGIDIGKHPQVLERVRFKVLGLIND